MFRKRALIAVGLLVVLAGCGAGNHAGSSSGKADVGTRSAGSATGSAGSVPAAPADAAGAAKPATLQTRDIVRTATLDVTVADVDRAADAAVSAAAAAGGRADADDRTTSGSDRQAHLVLRVPAARLTGLMNSVAHSGHENSRTDHGDDVTAATADVGARVTQLQISVARLQDFMRRSGTLADLVSLESQLTQREAELESTIAQQRALADQVSLTSLTVDLSATLPPPAKTQSGPAGFGSALTGGLHAVVLVLRVIAAGIGYCAPFLLVLVPLGFALFWLDKRRRANRAAAAPATTP